MKQSLQLRLGQQLNMTPQLQQAIRLLQLSTLDLQVEIQQALESNIMLEVAEEEEDIEIETPVNDKLESETEAATTENEAYENAESISSSEGSEENTEINLDEPGNMPLELTVDSEWEDVYDGNYTSDLPGGDFNTHDFSPQNSAVETLQDHLLWQLELTPLSDTDKLIARSLIDAIDEEGYLRTKVEEIAQSLELEIDVREVEVVLMRIQQFDPTGVGARDLRECLLLQLKELPPTTPMLKEANLLIREYLSVLGAKDYTQLLKRLKLNREQLQQVIQLIQTLNPRPGTKIDSHTASYIVPDVFVKKIKGQWRVDLNPDIAPRLRINGYYMSLITRAKNKSEADSLKNHLQEARWFIKSLRSRHETLLRVASCIVEKQKEFLDYGEEAMKPLVLHDIATELEMHESTISRVTTQKFIHTPRGIFELKYFFSSHVNTDSGGECSSTAIRALIKKLIAVENSAKPLSDSKIADTLSKRGIQVARRTVAKYREAMGIPPSNERKLLA
jgi:RNA polymerase sigma-54 factor